MSMSTDQVAEGIGVSSEDLANATRLSDTLMSIAKDKRATCLRIAVFTVDMLSGPPCLADDLEEESKLSKAVQIMMRLRANRTPAKTASQGVVRDIRRIGRV